MYKEKRNILHKQKLKYRYVERRQTKEKVKDLYKARVDTSLLGQYTQQESITPVIKVQSLKNLQWQKSAQDICHTLHRPRFLSLCTVYYSIYIL